VTLQALCGEVAGVLSLIAYAPYARATVRNAAQPNRATWIIWSLVGGLLFASYNAAAGGASRWVPLADTLGPAIIATLALRYGKGGWTPLDAGCLVLAGCSVIGWALTGSPMVALGINVVLAFLGAVPTFRSVYLYPDAEPALVWRLFLFSNLLNLLAIERGSFSSVYPVYAVFTSGCVNLLLCRPGPRPRVRPEFSKSHQIANLHGGISGRVPVPRPHWIP
jgi:hypothetical protein